jgi:hypothetical protein
MTGKQLLPLSGVAAVVLIVVSAIVVGETPETDAPMREVVSYYGDHDSDLQLGAGLLSLGSFFFVVFGAAIASLVRGAREPGAASAYVTMAGATTFAIGATILAGIAFTVGDSFDDIGPGTLQTLHVLESDMFFPLALGTAVFMLGAGVGTLRTDVLPTWLSWAAIVIGVVALSPIGFFGFLALGIWTLIASIMLAMRAGSEQSA